MAQPALHGYEQLVDTFVPTAVGLGPRGTATTPGHPGGAPVVTVHGGRGTGKTALCERLHDTYVGRLHVAKWPLPGAQPVGMAPPPDQASPLTSRPLAALGWLVRELNVDVPRSGRIEFPRFTYGLMAATTLYEPLDTQDTDGPALADLQRLEHRLRALEEALPTGERPLWDTLAAWVSAAIPLVTAFAPGLGPVEELLQRIIRQAGERGGPRLDQGALKWWDEELRGLPGSGIRKLLDWVFLSLRHQVAARARQSLEEHLAAAFLADIDADHRRRHWRIRPLPLILLDNTHTPTGRRLLDLLLTAYANAAGPDNARGAEVTRPVIVVTRLGARPRPATPAHQHPLSVPQFDTLAWQSPRSHAPEAWQVWLEAPALRADSIATALGTPCPRGLPNLVEQISAGRAGCARPLIEAARQNLRGGRRSPLSQAGPRELGTALLSLPTAGTEPGGQGGQADTVTDALLRYLVPDRDLIAPLLPWAVALRPQDVPTADPEYHRVRDLLKADHWYHADWPAGTTPAIPDRTLRELLLHHLRTTPARWTALHTAARERHTSGSAPHLHHTLALGRREEAVAGLHTLFASTGPRGWLTAVQIVCAAPHPPDGHSARHPEPAAPCPACPGPRPDDRHRAIGRLLDLLWGVSTLSSLYTDDPESPDNRLRLLLSGFDVAYEDQDLATADAARRWPVLLAQGRRVPELPIAGREH